MSNFIEITAEQRSPEWFAARAGRLTGSRADVLTMQGKKKGEESKTRRDYRLQLVAERIAGTSQEKFFFSEEMARGVELEPRAFAHYEADTGLMVMRSGFLQHREHMAGCSLDGHVNGYRGILEIKCPKMATHIAYLNDPVLLMQEYGAQVLHNIWITGAEWCDLISFDDRLPKHKQLVRMRITPGVNHVADHQARALKFLDEVDQTFNQLMDGVYT